MFVFAVVYLSEMILIVFKEVEPKLNLTQGMHSMYISPQAMKLNSPLNAECIIKQIKLLKFL